MITLGYIYDKSIDSDYKYWVNIPLLHGVPDSKTESELFKSYNEYERLKLEKQQVDEPMQKFLYAMKGRKMVSEPTAPTEEQKLFLSLASVCSLAGSKVIYNIGDAVVVGFLDNSLSKPIILGSYLTPGNEQITISRPLIKALSLFIDDSDLGSLVVLPNNTKIGGVTINDIKDCLSFINSLQGMGFDLDGFVKLLSVISNITSLVPGMPNIFDLKLGDLGDSNI